jgi:uncharacterized protein
VVTNSALYEGEVWHKRVSPPHSFSYRLAMCLIDLDDVEEIMAEHPLWSTNRGRPVQFRRSDYLGEASETLEAAVRQLVDDAIGVKSSGPIRLLTHLRTWGWCFNPVSFYFCYDERSCLQAVVASVTNTPWGESHNYVLRAHDGRVESSPEKQLHVSPYLPMGCHYEFTIANPEERCDIRANVFDDERLLLATGMHLKRSPLDRKHMSSLIVRYPFLTWRVSAGIYRQALRLRLKGANFHPHPARALPNEVRR